MDENPYKAPQAQLAEPRKRIPRSRLTWLDTFVVLILAFLWAILRHSPMGFGNKIATVVVAVVLVAAAARISTRQRRH